MVNTELKRAILAYGEQIRALPNVEGVMEGRKTRGGVRTGEPALVVFVEKKKPIEPSTLKRIVFRRLHPASAVPSTVGGVKTDVVESGKFEIFSPLEDCTWHRPVGPGDGTGHPDVTCGSIGPVAVDEVTGKKCAVTNNHVAAKSNEAEIGDPILSPCSHCGGTTMDAWGSLERFVPIELTANPCPIISGLVRFVNLVLEGLGRNSRIGIRQAGAGNLVDAALVMPYDEADLTSYVPGIGEPSPGIIEAYPGLPVEKTGWRTWHREGEVIGTGASLNISYGPGKVALFTDQIVIGSVGDLEFSAPGDSGSGIFGRDVLQAGSLILAEVDGVVKVVSLLFAGSDKEKITIGNRAFNVEQELGVRFV